MDQNAGFQDEDYMRCDIKLNFVTSWLEINM